MISGWFVEDLLLDRTNVKVCHLIHAIGSSSTAKGQAFVERHCQRAQKRPTVYGSHAEAWQDAQVDAVYIGTPHAMHKKATLAAIAAGKAVLCEKPLTINEKEALEVFAAAESKRQFVMEAMWLRFRPLVRTLQKKIHVDKVIGDIQRVFCDFGMDQKIDLQGPHSRFKDPSLGAGSLLDIGVYSLTWGLLALDPSLGSGAEMPKITSMQTLSDGYDTSSSVILHYPSTGKHAILTSTTEFKTGMAFCRIEGKEGSVVVEGQTASMPHKYTIYPRNSPPTIDGTVIEPPCPRELYQAEEEGLGFYHEADHVGLEISRGSCDSSIMPHAETLRVLRIMDEVRRQSGLKYPQEA